MKIGFIGLGMMGFRMAKNLIEKWGEINIWNRTKEKASKLSSARWQESPQKIAENSDLIFLILRDKEAVEDVIFGKDGMDMSLKEGSIIVDMTTNLPEYSLYLYQRLRDRNVFFMDSPVLGTTNQAENRELIIIAGGDKEVFNRVKPYLNAMGRKSIYAGKTGSGAYLKLFINILGAVSILTLSEGLVFLKQAGIDRELALDILSELSFASKAMIIKGKNVLRDDFSPFFKLELMEKDVRYFVETARKLNVPSFTASLASEIYRIGKMKDLSELDFSAIYKVFEKSHT